jgi:hypothetical protein
LNDSTGDPPVRRAKGLMARHPRLGILLIGALFLMPLCAMFLIVAVLIVS